MSFYPLWRAGILKKSGVDLSKIKQSYIKEDKQHFITLKEIKQDGIDINKILQENGLNGDFKYGIRLNGLRNAYKGQGHFAITKVDIQLAKQLGLINEETILSEYLRVANTLQNAGIDLNKVPERKTENGKQHYIILKDIQQEGIDINKIIVENGLDGQYKYGMRLHILRQAYKGKGTYVINEEEKKLAEELKLVKNKLSLKKEEKQQILQENQQSKELCEMYEKLLKKKGNRIYE